MIKEQLYSMYHIDKMSLQDISNKLGCSREKIYYHFRKMGIATRTKAQARQLVYEQNKIKINSFDKYLFDKWTPQSAYLLGLLYSDGNISYTVNAKKIFKRISFSQKDLIFMNKVIKLFLFEGKISKNKRTNVLSINMSGNYMSNRLEKLGLHTNKSLTIKFPNIPDKYHSHFIRGIFDGDGSINKTDGRISIVSGSKDFINSIFENLKLNNISSKVYHYKYSVIKISKLSEKIEFAKYIYSNKEDMFFDKKYNIFYEKNYL